MTLELERGAAQEGVDWQESIGRIAEMLVHTDGAPAVLFDRMPGYPSGYRVLVNAQGERRLLVIPSLRGISPV